jgi:hypothetical protein
MGSGMKMPNIFNMNRVNSGNNKKKWSISKINKKTL